MFKLVWARSHGRGRTHCPGRFSRRVRATSPLRVETWWERGGRHGGSAASLLWRRPAGSTRPRGAGEGEQRGCRRAARAPGRAVSASPHSPLHILGAGRRRAPRPPAARLPARARSLGGTAPRRADGIPAAGALIPGPAPSVPARGGPGPAPQPPEPLGRAPPRPGAAQRPWLSAKAPRARPAARLAARARVSGVLPAPRYAGRRRIVSSEEAAEPRLGRPGRGCRASSEHRRHLVAEAQQCTLPARGGALGTGGRESLRLPSAVQLPRSPLSEISRTPPASRAEGCLGSCRAQRSTLGRDTPSSRPVPGPSLQLLPLSTWWASAPAPHTRFDFALQSSPILFPSLIRNCCSSPLLADLNSNSTCGAQFLPLSPEEEDTVWA